MAPVALAGAVAVLTLVGRARGARLRAQRGVRASGVVGYVGLWGSGKSIALARDCILALRAGQKVYATFHVTDPVTGLSAEYLDPAHDAAEQLAAIEAPPPSDEEITAEQERDAWVRRSRLRLWLRRHLGVYARAKRIPAVLVAIDEINVVFPSRMWSLMPVKMLYAWAQGGKRGIAVRWTAQTERRVDTVAREVSHEVARTRVALGLLGRPILLRQGYYLPEDASASEQTRQEKRIRARWLYVPWWVLEGYDTLEQVRPSVHLEQTKTATRGRRAA